MQLTVGFGSELIGDLCYPPLRVGQMVNLSFQVVITSRIDRTVDSLAFQVATDAECVFIADVLRIYRLPTERPLAILKAGDLLFYIDGSEVDLLRIGDRISGAGSLVVDYYIWAEFLKEYKDPPNLFYKLKVERLRGLYIRSQPPSMSWRNTAFSDRLRGERYSDADIREVSAMYLRESECPFYLVDLDDQDITEAIVPKTFLCASAFQPELGTDA